MQQLFWHSSERSFFSRRTTFSPAVVAEAGAGRRRRRRRRRRGGVPAASGGGTVRPAAGRSPAVGGGGGRRGSAAGGRRGAAARPRGRRGRGSAAGGGRGCSSTTGGWRRCCRRRPAFCRTSEQLPGRAGVLPPALSGLDQPAPVAPQPTSCKAVAGPQRRSFRPDPACGRCRPRRRPGVAAGAAARLPVRRARAPRICPKIVPAASRTGKSCRAIVSSGATKSAIRSPKTTLAWTSGAIIPAGRHGASRRPIAGRPGDSGRLDWLRRRRTVQLRLRRKHLLRRRPGLLWRPAGRNGRRSMPSRPTRSPPARRRQNPRAASGCRWACSRSRRTARLRRRADHLHAVGHQQGRRHRRHVQEHGNDQVQTLEGMADKKSQRVAWSVAGQKRPIMETGISNLTQDSSPALIHFADGQTQQWLMVRLPEPK